MIANFYNSDSKMFKHFITRKTGSLHILSLILILIFIFIVLAWFLYSLILIGSIIVVVKRASCLYLIKADWTNQILVKDVKKMLSINLP